MKKTFTIFSVMLLVIITASNGGATTIHVPGDYATIQLGINAANFGDTVLVANGTYYENLTASSNPITLASMFIMSGNTADISNTVIDGSNTGTVITIDPNSPYVVNVIGFTITHGLGAGNWPNVHGGGMHTGDAGFVHIDHCYFHHNTTSGDSNRGAGIYLNSSFSTISNCVFHDNMSTFGPAVAIGNDTEESAIESCEMYSNVCTATTPDNLSVISVTYSDNITVSHCMIHHNNGTGIRNWGSSVTGVINCTIAGNDGYGVYNSYYGSNIYVQNTISAFNSLEALFNNTQYSPIALCEYSDMMGATGMPWFGDGCMDADPMFADTLSWDYSLATGSPCIDAGDPDSPLDPDGSIADMGAIYHAATGLDDETQMPIRFTALNTYPNPFNAAATIKYVIAQEGEIALSVYNTLGQEVEILYSGWSQPGEYTVTWNAESYPSGIFFARLHTSDDIRNVKMVLLK